MPVELLVKGCYTSTADALFERACNFSDLIEASRRISKYPDLPAVQMQEGKVYKTDITVLGIFKFPDYQISIDKICPNSRVLETSELCDTVRFWRRRLQIKETVSGATWIDRIVIDAGAKTSIVSRYAKYIYEQQHRNRQAVSVEATLCRSYRSIRPGLPMFLAAD